MVLPSKVLKTCKWRVHHLSGLHHLLGKKFFPDAEPELSKPQPVPISPWRITCCYWEEFDSVTIVTTLLVGCYQIVLYLPLCQVKPVQLLQPLFIGHMV